MPPVGRALSNMILALLPGFLALLSLALTVWQWRAAARFPLHKRIGHPAFSPAVTIFKPLKGCEPDTAACLRSWVAQDYGGQVQILFGVADPDDPVCRVVNELIAASNRGNAELVICDRNLGANRKVSTLVQLQARAKHPIWVVSDADVRAPADLLASLVAPLREGTVGLVNCLYSLANPATLPMRWEAVAINADFWSQVLQARSLKAMDFALGAVMAFPRGEIQSLGGFEALVDFLADDYQLGNRIHRAGRRLELCPVVAECWSAPMSFREVWAHQLRWARTIRCCRPAQYFFSILSNATLWPLLWLAIEPSKKVLLVCLICWVVRMGTALAHQKSLTRSRAPFFYDWLVLAKDLLQVAIWFASWFGNQIVWRGQRYQVVRGGKLQPC